MLQNDESRFVGCNIGVACGNGIIAVDVDPRNGGHDTVTSWKIGGFELPETLTVYTPSSGYHKYLRSDRIKNSVFDGIEVQSLGKYVVGPTSTFDGKDYAVDESCLDIADSPEWLEDFCRKPEIHLLPSIGDSYELEKIKLILEMINPDLHYSDWVKIGFFLRSIDPDSDGFQMFLNFSSGAIAKCRPRKFLDVDLPKLQKKWLTFKPNGAISLGTLLHLAYSEASRLELVKGSQRYLTVLKHAEILFDICKNAGQASFYLKLFNENFCRPSLGSCEVSDLLNLAISTKAKLCSVSKQNISMEGNEHAIG